MGSCRLKRLKKLAQQVSALPRWWGPIRPKHLSTFASYLSDFYGCAHAYGDGHVTELVWHQAYKAIFNTICARTYKALTLATTEIV